MVPSALFSQLDVELPEKQISLSKLVFHGLVQSTWLRYVKVNHFNNAILIGTVVVDIVHAFSVRDSSGASFIKCSENAEKWRLQTASLNASGTWSYRPMAASVAPGGVESLVELPGLVALSPFQIMTKTTNFHHFCCTFFDSGVVLPWVPRTNRNFRHYETSPVIPRHNILLTKKLLGPENLGLSRTSVSSLFK